LVRQYVSSFVHKKENAAQTGRDAARSIEAVNPIGSSLPGTVTKWWTARFAVHLYTLNWRVASRS
jgi:hypothetical protein